MGVSREPDDLVSPNRATRSALLRPVLGALLAFVALNALGGGIYGLLGAKGIPKEWLEGSPFASYFVPSLVLLFVVGGSLLSATIALFTRSHYARRLVTGSGVVLLLWIGVQVAIIGYVSWMQPAMAASAVMILAMARRLEAPR